MGLGGELACSAKSRSSSLSQGGLSPASLGGAEGAGPAVKKKLRLKISYTTW